jgi:hypothetical protein
MVSAIEPVPSAEELAAIVAALEISAESEQRASVAPRPSRWRAAARAFDDDATLLR